MEDLRRAVEGILLASEPPSHGWQRENWMRLLQAIGGTEQEAQALLSGGRSDRISVKEFLDLLFEPCACASLVLVPQKNDPKKNTTRTNNLKEYFEKHYRVGGTFRHSDYEISGNETMWTWMHKPTGIQVWCDAIDLTSGDGGQVFFHYTSELAFGNITHPSKEAAEIWASLRTEGPNANAWWGKGIYTVPLPPDQWESREQLLDNNFRNMMQRDRESDDPQKGPRYVDREYPKRAAFCVPILIDPANAFDVSIRATPEMEAAGKEPGRNLANKLLNEPGKPPRCCVVLRVSGEDGVQHARGQLLDTLRQCVRLVPANLEAKCRLVSTLRLRGFYQEALPLAQEMVALCESTDCLESAFGFGVRSILSKILYEMGNLREAERVDRQLLDAKVKAFGPEHEYTIDAVHELAVAFSGTQGREGEAAELFRKVLAFQETQLGPSHLDTVHTMTNLASSLCGMGNHQEAIDLHRRALGVREKMLGPEHPETLQSVSRLAVVLHDRGDQSEALALQGRALEARERHLGPQHPSSVKSLQRFVSVLYRMIIKEEEPPGEIVELCRGFLAGRAKMLGHRHPDTVDAMVALSLSLTGAGNYNEAVELLRQILETREKTLGVDHPTTLHTIILLADARARIDLSETDLQSRAFESREKLEGWQCDANQVQICRDCHGVVFLSTAEWQWVGRDA